MKSRHASGSNTEGSFKANLLPLCCIRANGALTNQNRSGNCPAEKCEGPGSAVSWRAKAEQTRFVPPKEKEKKGGETEYKDFILISKSPSS